MRFIHRDSGHALEDGGNPKEDNAGNIGPARISGLQSHAARLVSFGHLLRCTLVQFIPETPDARNVSVS
jgi:hypothetical protein